MLIDEDYYARVEGREIVANLSKAAGLAQMIAAMRPDLDNIDEYIRNTTARAFSVVASALGIPALLPFLKAVCQSKKSWQARHTGIKICQQIAILMGCAVLPHLKSMVDIIKHGLKDENQKVGSSDETARVQGGGGGTQERGGSRGRTQEKCSTDGETCFYNFGFELFIRVWHSVKKVRLPQMSALLSTNLSFESFRLKQGLCC